MMEERKWKESSRRGVKARRLGGVLELPLCLLYAELRIWLSEAKLGHLTAN